MKAVLRKEQTAATALRARLLEVDDAHLLSPVASGTLAQSVIANPRLDVDRTWLADRNEQFDGARSLNSGRILVGVGDGGRLRRQVVVRVHGLNATRVQFENKEARDCGFC